MTPTLILAIALAASCATMIGGVMALKLADKLPLVMAAQFVTKVGVEILFTPLTSPWRLWAATVGRSKCGWW